MEWSEVKEELKTPIQSSRKQSQLFVRRQDSTGWIRNLSLTGLEFQKMEMQIQITTTSAGESIVIQYPGKESIQGMKSWKNAWDFRPKILKEENIDLTFQQIWDPLFDELNVLQGERKKRVGQALAALFYRMAFMIDYRKEPAESHKVTMVRIAQSIVPDNLPLHLAVGSFWNYSPPQKVLRMISEILPNWKGMSFEAFLHYNSLLAWNEDCKMAAKIEGWTPADPRGRINTLLTHLRVIGFILEKVRPSALLGGFATRRGMSPASNKEIMSICEEIIV